MNKDDEFEPRLGRMRGPGKPKGKKYLHRVLAAANLAGGGSAAPARLGRFDGSRIGRGAAAGRMLASRDAFSAFRQRRVIIKSRIVKLAGKRAAAAQAHLRYIERDGTTRDGERGRLYGAETDKVDGKTFLERGAGDRHQFRFIVSPEDGAEYEDLKPLTRRLMTRMEEDLGTKLDWAAVDHFNTGHPHTHIILRGRDDRGKDLIIARNYLTSGMRERAAELVDLDLGPRTENEIKARLRAEIEQERLTSIDRSLLRDADANGMVGAAGRNAFEQSLRMGRLRKLERLRLAEPVRNTGWRLDPDLADTLRRMGERGDIIRTMQRSFAARGTMPALADQAIYDPGASDARPLIGRVVERGFADELNDRHYLLVEATDGRSYYAAIGKGENVDPLESGAVVRIEPVSRSPRQADQTIAEVAAANGGRYDVDAHMAFDSRATEAFAQSHVRRLEAIRRLTGRVERRPDGSWIIAPDHLDHASAYEAAKARDRPVAVEVLSSEPLEKLIEGDAATWLDRELAAKEPEALRDAGFGRTTRDALARRRQWLLAEGLAQEEDGRFALRKGAIAALRRRELLRLGAELGRELGKPFAETDKGSAISGIYRRRVDGLGGRYALVEKSKEFTLVPWRPVLGRHVGKNVSGIMRDGPISWTFGRGRSGPGIS